MRPWNTFDAYLFDIDGTLLQCRDAVHYHGFCKSLSDFAERPLNLDGVTTHGNVDVAILRDALKLADIPEATWRPHLDIMRDTLCTYVEEHAAEFNIDVLPGVPGVLAHLRARGAILGLATGNLERVGWAKLHACGLKSAFHFGGFSDTCETRRVVFAAALAQARAAAGNAASVCVLGDTPADIEAAHANQIEVIAVATGVYSLEDLGEAGPDLLVPTLGALPGLTG